MKIQHDVHAIAPGFAHGFYAARCVLEGPGAFNQFRNRNGHGFHCGKTGGDAVLHAGTELFGLESFVHTLQAAAAQVVIEAKRVAHRAAQQLADRLAQFFAFDIPQRLVDAAYGRHVGDAAAPEVLSVHGLPEVLNPPRILPDDQDGNVFDRAYHTFRLPFQRGFAPSR